MRSRMLLAGLATALGAAAQAPPSPAPRTYALVSAVGSTLSYVRERKSVGTRMPGRASWHRVVVVTPRYLNSAREGLGERLHGIGVYVQPAEKVPANRDDFFGRVEDETRAADGHHSRSTNNDVEEDFPPEKIAPFLERFVELSTAQALREAFGPVTVSEPRIVAPKQD
jgi:hypothetical protein